MKRCLFACLQERPAERATRAAAGALSRLLHVAMAIRTVRAADADHGRVRHLRLGLRRLAQDEYNSTGPCRTYIDTDPVVMLKQTSSAYKATVSRS